jgi:hypothetical protein
MIMKIVTRKEALAKSMTRYYTGKFCKYGHQSERFTSNRECVTCHDIRKGSIAPHPVENKRSVRCVTFESPQQGFRRNRVPVIKSDRVIQI